MAHTASEVTTPSVAGRRSPPRASQATALLGRHPGELMAVALVIVAVTWKPFPAPLGVVVNGALVGGRIALIALGLALVHRANRIVNFAQGDLGAVPASFAVLLITGSLGLNYFLGFAAGLVAAIALGGVVEMLVIRRFFRAPRLLLTVATIGLAQLLTGLALLLPTWFGTESSSSKRLNPPFRTTFEIGGTFFDGNDVLAMIAIPVAFVALGLFLRRSKIGTAVRASAENADRALMLGIGVRRIHTYVWVIAATLAYVGMFLRAGAVGLPIGSVLGPAFLLQALAAAVLGRMERLPTIAIAAIGLGMIDQAMTFQPGNEPARNDVVLFVVILVGLLVSRSTTSRRAEAEQASTWQAAREIRPIPGELVQLPEVRYARWAIAAAVAAAVLTLPLWLSASRINLAAAIVLFAIVGLSLVVLTGWSGQVSLGQVGFVGVGAAVGGGLTARQGLDLALAVPAAGIAGAVAAIVIGYPALRRRGLTLAVTTLGFALVTSSYLLNRQYFDDWLPASRIDRADVFGISVSSETAFYFVAVGALALTMAGVWSLRHSRLGRVLIGIRENERAARAYGVHATVAQLTALAISGFIAASAGALYVQHQSGLGTSAYLPEESLKVFSMSVIGGLGSIPGVVLGATYVRGADFFLPAEWQFLASGAGLLLILLVLPGGLGAAVYDTRDILLRRVARRRGLVVPSLLADARTDGPSPPLPAPTTTPSPAPNPPGAAAVDRQPEPEPSS